MRNSTTTKKLTIILEKSDGELYGRIDDPEFLYTTCGNDKNEVEKNLRNLIADFVKHEGKTSKRWNNVNAKELTFDFSYDLAAFFEIYDTVKITPIAKKAGVNESLLRQYVTGAKKASAVQAKKIESAVHQLGKELSMASIC